MTVSACNLGSRHGLLHVTRITVRPERYLTKPNTSANKDFSFNRKPYYCVDLHYKR